MATTSSVLKSASAQMLGSLANILKKGQDHAASHKLDEAVFLTFRLFPDMFPLTRQVQIATDQIARGTARLAGLDLPSHPDVEASFAQLIERVNKVNAYCQASDSAAIDKRSGVQLSIPVGGGQELPMTCDQYLSGMVIPNLYFHAATTYNILRHNGVVLGKKDFLRPN